MNPKTDWYTNFFNGPVLDVLRNMTPPAVTLAECDFLHKELGLAPGSRVLDVPCGAGRHAAELARRQCRVTGIDSSKELIADARTACDGRAATFHVADMCELPPAGESPFDAAYCMGNSFAYMDDARNAAFLATVRQSLRPGGRFLLETRLSAESVMATPRTRTWYEFDGKLMLHETRYEPAAGRLVSEYGFLVDGKIDRRAAGYRIYMFRELAALLESAGFRLLVSYGSLGGEPFVLGSPDLLMLCEAA
ncbi:hypothetical protein B7486_12020 [cyanobacterium TDX16]|nr:hypothetical protein B7486_12020 [cyanobacterium TDX16]